MQKVKLVKIYQQFKYGTSDDFLHINSPSDIQLPNVILETHRKIYELPFPSTLEIDPTRLTFNKAEILGHGAYGIVYRGMWDRCRTVAVKTMTDKGDDSKLAALLTEVKMMNYVGRHGNVVQLLGVQISSLRRG